MPRAINLDGVGGLADRDRSMSVQSTHSVQDLSMNKTHALDDLDVPGQGDAVTESRTSESSATASGSMNILAVGMRRLFQGLFFHGIVYSILVIVFLRIYTFLGEFPFSLTKILIQFLLLPFPPPISSSYQVNPFPT